ncbi:MAG TPA: Mut7-C RNAse domain-containing protein [Candidatus Binataceae bacterium]|nr:Mut7-C RNAse domain-containing protein [Candidatus Binataceae bacterium]
MEEPPKLAADRMLMRLGRWLRLLGADVVTDAQSDGAHLLARARVDGRLMLTRDKRLRSASDVIFIEANDLRAQLREVLARVPFDTRQFALTRCSRCNLLLRPVPREMLSRRVPPFVFASQHKFSACDGCGRIYWRSTHPERISRLLDSIGF